MDTPLMRSVQFEDRLMKAAASHEPPIPAEEVKMHIQLLQSERRKNFEAAVSIYAGVMLQTMDKKESEDGKV
jgi:hypothetical protein